MIYFVNDKGACACIVGAKLEIGTDNSKIAGSVFPDVQSSNWMN